MKNKFDNNILNSFLVKKANFYGYLEFPCIKKSCKVPNKIIPFSKAISCKDHKQWIHFYQYDNDFERLWRNPKKYLHILKQYDGIILPDFSTYRNMPLIMQMWNIYRSRAIGTWLQYNKIDVIPNIRFGDKRTYTISCYGIECGGTIAIGSLGNMKRKEDKKIFLSGVDIVVKILKPTAIVIYGNVSEEKFEEYKKEGIKIIHFDSEISIIHKEVL